MLKPTTQNWFFPTVTGVLSCLLYAILSIIFFTYVNSGVHSRSTGIFIGELSLAAGACTIATAMWISASGRSWLLALSGLACGALGLMLTFWRGPIAFRTISLLIVVMAVSLAVHELQAARFFPQPGLRKWFSGAACVISFGFALVFLGFVLRLIPLIPSPSAQTFLWIGSYFAFSAICMAGISLPSRGPGLLIFREPISYPH